MTIPVRSLLVSGLFVFLLTACNLQTGIESEITITDAPTVIVVTLEPSPTVVVETVQATGTPVSTLVNTGGDNQIITCIPGNPDWHIYIAQAGDTLAGIAVASNSTVESLASANCIANINLIDVGQMIRVPQMPAPTMSWAETRPLVDTGPVPSNVCGVEPLIPPIEIFGEGGASFALLQGTVLVTDRNDVGYFVDVPGYGGYVLANEVRELGINCPEIPLPVINQAPPFEAACMVVGLNGPANVYRPGPANPVATLIQAQYGRTDDSNYIIHIPSLGGDSYVLRTEAILSGDDCLDPLPLESNCLIPYDSTSPVVISPSTIVEDDCVSISPGVITVSYPDAPAGFVMVDFYMQHESGNIDVIGTDTNPADGASIDFLVHDSLPRSLVYAFASTDEVNSRRDSGQVAVYLSK